MKKGTKFQHKRPDEPQVCAICGFPMKTYNALGKHVAKYHSDQCTMKEYVDKYIEPFAHKCPYCDNERNFVHGRYKETCPDKKCIQKHREATNVQKYGNKCSLKGTNEQKVVDAIVEKYGVDNVFKLDSMQQLARQRTKEKYGKEYSSQVPELRKKVVETCMKKFGYKTNLLNPDHIERIKQTCLEKYGNQYVCASEYTRQKTIEHNQQLYGVDWFMSTEEFKEKSDATLIERYGTTNTSSVPEIQAKRYKTNMERYGCIHPIALPEFRERAKQTMLQHYGVTHPSHSIIINERKHQTNIDRYGSPEYLGSDEFKSKIKSLLFNKYGVFYAAQIPGVREKREATNLLRYGVKSLVGTKEVCDMAKSTMRERYGVDYVLQNPEMWYKITHHGKVGKYLSMAEAQFASLCDAAHVHYKYNDIINGKCWDFVIYDDNEVIQCIVEIDGEMCHSIALDTNGEAYTDTRNAERFLLVPLNVRYICTDSKYVSKAFMEMQSCIAMSYSDWIDRMYSMLPVEFPYPSFSDGRLKNDYKRLCNMKASKKSMLATSTIKHFHRSIYHSKVNGRLSPVDVWSDKSVLRNCIYDHMLYMSPLSSHCIADGFNVCEIAPRVNVFSSGLAKYFIHKYLQHADTIFNPFHGFSGIMLGTTATNKAYIGYDIDPIIIDEARSIIEFHQLNASLRVCDSMQETGTFDALFTSVPYRDTEIWTGSPESHTCDEWIDLCLAKYKCKQYLFVVDNVDKYKPYLVDTIKHHSRIRDEYEYVVLIEKR